MITPESLVQAGWKKMGNAWYHPSGKKTLTNFDNRWQLWQSGVNKIVTQMNEL